MDQARQRAGQSRDLLEVNRRFYDALWSGSRLIEPHRFNTWPLVCSLAAEAPRRLEVAPGLRPRLPIHGTQFLDVSEFAVAKLCARGANALKGNLTSLPFDDESFDLVSAFDVVEHVEDDDAAWSELARVTAPGAVLLVSVPLHPASWTVFDEFVGHFRRYEPEQIRVRLAQHGFSLERSAVFGMQPKSSRLLDLGMWFLSHRRAEALWWYNNLFMPLGVHFQRKLSLTAGMIDTDKVDEVLLVCRKRARERP